MIAQTVFYQRSKQPVNAKLSLIALMDIFTILVFFLLMNSGDSSQIENARLVKLPDATSAKAPYADVVIMLDEENIYIEDKAIASIEKVIDKPDELIEPLQVFLKAHMEKVGELKGFEKENGLALTIMGNKNVSYELIRTVMKTCQFENFRNISLAVNQTIGQVQGGADSAPQEATPAIPVGVGG